MKFSVLDIAKQADAQRDVSITAELPSILFNGEQIRVNAARLEGRIVNRDTLLELTGSLFAEVTLLCGRCLQDYPYTLELSIHEEFVSQADEEHPDRQLYDGKEIDFRPLLEDNIVLNLPIERLCRTDCKGLCPICGADLNRESEAHTHEDVPDIFPNNPFYALNEDAFLFLSSNPIYHFYLPQIYPQVLLLYHH